LANEKDWSGRAWCETHLASMDAEVLRQAKRIARGLSVEPMTSPPPRWLSSREAAAYLGLTLKALEKRVERREIPFSKLGSTRRFDIRALDRMLENSSNEREVLHRPLGRRRP
jgi:excisionase family DNA binding protein